ncbi:DNA repair protein RecN [Porticoccus sp.]|uniref:DNA repair protein RecN n=1 Tax=Porticoccus sp. TaxID=2024853 RepID=UPI003F6A137E
MLTTLTVKHFTLVEALEVDFATGMTALTGETGAGKSLVLDALAMALGDRADTDRIRQGQERAEVSALFDLTGVATARQWLIDNDFADNNDEEALLRRLLTREGRSRGYINGQAATMQQLRELGEMLIDIHSQHEHQSLLRKETHHKILDDFARCSELAGELKQVYQQWTTTMQLLDKLENAADELRARQELLTFQLSELEQLSLEEGELEQLEQQQLLLGNAEAILRDSGALLQLCCEADDFNLQDSLGRALQLLANMPGKPAPLIEAEKLLNSAAIEVAEAGREIQQHLDRFERDPARLQQLEARLSTIYQLARKHRISPTELPARHLAMQEELDNLAGGEGGIEKLRQQATGLSDRYFALAENLTACRTAAAAEFSALVEQQFSALSMDGARFIPQLTPVKSGQLTANGVETVEFLIATNPGEPPRPLAKIASGGELSRISLAIQVIAANHSAVPTLIFDEVDVGIGGTTADVVGKLLRQLGGQGQVICVTHLPQVAACAHHHLLVSKTTHKHSANSTIRLLSGADRTNEIARMLGGAKVTDTSLSHAREMLQLGG